MGQATIFMLHRVSYFGKNKLFPNENFGSITRNFWETLQLELPKLRDIGFNPGLGIEVTLNYLGKPGRKV